MSVAVVIPVFDRFEFLPALLRQLSSQSVLPDHVVIVDHGRQSLSLQGDWPFQVEILKRDSSLWFAAATNEGLVHARNGNPRFLMILNDDVRIGCDHWLARLLEVASDREVMVASTAVDDGLQVWYAGVKLKVAAFRYDFCERGRPYGAIDQSPVHCDVLPTRGLLFPARLLDRIGYLNDRALPHHSSDYEWTARAKSQGVDLVMVRDVYVITDCDSPPPRTSVSLADELMVYFKNPYLKGSFPVARAYAANVFTQPYRTAFLAAHCGRFFARCIWKRLTFSTTS